MKAIADSSQRVECAWHDLPAGSKSRTTLPLVTMPDGTAVGLPVLAVRGTRPGKSLLVSAGVHGDEFEGMAALWRLFKQLDPAEVLGTFVAVPIVNVPAYQRGGRTSEDHQDLARVFPGAPAGTVTEQIAYHFTHRFIAHADLYCDLHSAGQYYEIEPLAGYMLVQGPALELQRQAARAFGVDLVWGTAGLPGRSLSAARDFGVAAIYAELRGAGQCLEADVQRYVFGVGQLLKLLGMVEQAPEPFVPKVVVEDPREGSGYLQIQNRAPSGGFFAPSVELGQQVQREERIGDLLDPTGRTIYTARTTVAGRVVFLRSFPRVRAGDPLVTVLETAKC